ncbi:hypothetical protein ASG37_16705 [Sphingomonas sp. Leaf407]|uniref:hypothetical protein n=1 Tax=unclassified Sphingomonas TaxID=196159 RepID=UPI0006FCF394|nr:MULTISPECIES: hypothetical protein [unclassified Sphingomonas]KQN33785.1 hypothetical protein ASE97_16695 [Sphingomonas sp. Leaf42]KQT25066.1 hypothetical protein ASG37_16705 [Sphingomonas sp. Leaf407]
MDGDVIRIRAMIRLLGAFEGGRPSPIRGSYRPSHNFFGPADRAMMIGFIDLPEGSELRPGESMEASIAFWQAPGLDELLHPGRQWRIQEGLRLVGIGTVLAVLPPGEDQ